MAGHVDLTDIRNPSSSELLFVADAHQAAAVNVGLDPSIPFFTSSQTWSSAFRAGNELLRTDVNLTRFDALTGSNFVFAELANATYYETHTAVAPVDTAFSLGFLTASTSGFDLVFGNGATARELVSDGFEFEGVLNIDMHPSELNFAVPLKWNPALSSSTIQSGHIVSQWSAGFNMSQISGGSVMASTALKLTNDIEVRLIDRLFFPWRATVCATTSTQ